MVEEQKRDPSFVLRSNSVSLVWSLVVLVLIVGTVYYFVPSSEDNVANRAVELREANQPFVVTTDKAVLTAFAEGVFGEKIPFATEKVVGVSKIRVRDRNALVGYYNLEKDQVLLLAMKRRKSDVPFNKERGDILVTSWLNGDFLYIAAGPKDSIKSWAPALLAP